MERFFRDHQRGIAHKDRGAIAGFLIVTAFFSVFSVSPSQAADTQASPAVTANTSNSTTLDFANGLYVRKMYDSAIGEYEKFIQNNPGSPEVSSAQFRLADSYYFSKDYQVAINGFHAFIKKFPEDSRVSIAWFRIATAYYYLKQTAPAVKIFQELVHKAQDPTVRGGALFYMGKCYEAKNKLDKSVEIFQRLLKEYPQNEFATYAAIAMGDHYLRQKRYEEAVTAYKIAADRNMPADVAKEAQFKVAEIHFFNKDYVRAKESYEKLFQSSREEADEVPAVTAKIRANRERALMNLFYCDLQTQDLESATKRFEAEKDFIQQAGHMDEAKVLIASILIEKKNYEAALTYLEQAIADPQVDKAVKEKAIFKKSQVLTLSGKKEQGLQELQNLLDLNAANPAMVYFQKGELLKEIGNFTEAAAAYEAVPEKDSGEYFKAALYQLGDVYSKAGNPEKARQAFERYIGLFHDDEDIPKAYLQIIQMDLDASNFARAVDTTLQFIHEYPKNPLADIAYYKLGVALTGLKKFSQASDAFQTVMHEYPSSKVYVDSIYGAAASSESGGQTKDAISFYETLVQGYPDHPLFQDAQDHLAYLYVQDGDLEKASDFYKDILLNKPSVKIQPEGAFWLLQYLSDHGDTATMNQILELLPKRFPGQNLSHEINFFLGESAMAVKDYPKAIGYYSESIKAKADGAYAANATLGLGLASAAVNDNVSAEKNFTEALRYDSEIKVTMRARFEIADLHLKAGDVAEAAKAFMLVAILYDDEKYTPLSLYKAGECFTQLTKFDEAHKALSELKAHYPKSEWADKIPDKEKF